MDPSIKNPAKSSKIVAVIKDEDCMRPEGWIDYATESKNEQFINDAKRALEMGTPSFLDFIHQTMPNWIIDMCDEYDCDLSNMAKNWNHLCNNVLKIPTQKIILVDYVCKCKVSEEKDKNKNIKFICDELTKLGYSVKDKEIFMMCKGCHKLMLSTYAQETLWKQPARYHCRECQTNK